MPAPVSRVASHHLIRWSSLEHAKYRVNPVCGLRQPEGRSTTKKRIRASAMEDGHFDPLCGWSFIVAAQATDPPGEQPNWESCRRQPRRLLSKRSASAEAEVPEDAFVPQLRYTSILCRHEGHKGVLSADRTWPRGMQTPREALQEVEPRSFFRTGRGGAKASASVSSLRAPGICILASAIMGVWQAPALQADCKSLRA